MCKKQTSVSHCSTESEIISLDAGLRMDATPALDLWDVVVEVLSKLAQGSLCTTGDHSINKHQTKSTKRESERVSNCQM